MVKPYLLKRIALEGGHFIFNTLSVNMTYLPRDMALSSCTIVCIPQ